MIAGYRALLDARRLGLSLLALLSISMDSHRRGSGGSKVCAQSASPTAATRCAMAQDGSNEGTLINAPDSALSDNVPGTPNRQPHFRCQLMLRFRCHPSFPAHLRPAGWVEGRL